MPRDNEDIFQYDNLYEGIKRSNEGSSGTDGESAPLGSGRKSEFAIGKKKSQSGSSPREIKTGQTKKTNSSGKTKKSVSSDSIKKKKRKPHELPSAPVRSKTAVKKTGAVKKASSKNAVIPKKKPVKRKKSIPAGRKSPGEELASFAYLGAMAVGGCANMLFGTRRKRIIAASLLGIALIFCCAMGIRSIYKSNTLLSDDGKELDDTAIYERIITEEQNREKVTYFLIVGVDKSQMLTDCIWEMCFDNETHKMNVLQIPRDTYVGEDSNGLGKINGVYKSPKTVKWCENCNKEIYDDEIIADKHTVCNTKISSRTESNINALIRVVNSRLSLPVDHYVLFDFEGFEKVIDALGGIDILLEEEMKVYPNKNDYIVLPSGLNHLDGETALKFMRNRKIYADGDLGRVKAQRRIIKAMLEKVDDMTSVDLLKILKASYGSFKTDMSLEEIRSFIAPVKKCGVNGLHMFELPGNDHWVKGHPSYYVCDEQQTAEVINAKMLPYSPKITAYNISFPELGY